MRASRPAPFLNDDWFGRLSPDFLSKALGETRLKEPSGRLIVPKHSWSKAVTDFNLRNQYSAVLRALELDYLGSNT